MYLLPLRTLVTLSCFGEGKEIRIVCSKMLNVVATLQQRCGNVLITSESDAVTTSETDIGTTLIFDRVTTLWQCQQRRCDKVVTTSLCQLGNSCIWRSSCPEVFCKKDVLEILKTSQGNTATRVSFCFRPATLLKKNPGPVLFLWNLRKF